MNGLRLAVSWLTVLPVPARTVDERACRQAITLAPLVGVLVGIFGAAVLWALTALGAPALLAGLLTVAALVLVTRGMHIDGLADAVDGLGCYGPPERALSVMRDGGTGPFAVVALIVVVGVQAAAFAEIAASGRWAAVVLACAVGRAGFVLCCRRGIPAARPEGMGALVASSQPIGTVVAWWLLLAAAAFWLPGIGWPGIGWLGIGWQGLLAVVLAAAALTAFSTHTRRRFGGITGDVLGAAAELGCTVVLAVTALG